MIRPPGAVAEPRTRGAWHCEVGLERMKAAEALRGGISHRVGASGSAREAWDAVSVVDGDHVSVCSAAHDDSPGRVTDRVVGARGFGPVNRRSGCVQVAW
jgi:hypothetical protein